MNFEKLGLYVFLKYYKQLDTARGHLASSLRELLLAMSSSVEVVHDQAQETPILKRVEAIPHFLKKAQSLLSASADILPKPAPAKIVREKNPQADHFKKEIISAIVDVIDEEMERLPPATNPETRMRLKALEAVKLAMLKYLGLGVGGPNPLNHDSPRFRTQIDFPLAK